MMKRGVKYNVIPYFPDSFSLLNRSSYVDKVFFPDT